MKDGREGWCHIPLAEESFVVGKVEGPYVVGDLGDMGSKGGEIGCSWWKFGTTKQKRQTQKSDRLNLNRSCGIRGFRRNLG